MLIDWFTVGAQVINFLILVWLMKRFLYKPILDAIDARERRVAAELADADAKKAEAQKERDEFRRKNDAFDQQRAALLSTAADAANAERQRLLDKARQAADALSTKRRVALQNEAQNLDQALSRRTQQEVFAIARKALMDLAGAGLEERLSAVFARRLRAMGGPMKASLGDAIRKSSDAALVRSAFDLPAEQRAVIQNVINETFSADVHLRFETAPDIVGGIELTAGGQKVAWSIADYLGSMEKEVAELLKAKDKPDATTASGAQTSPHSEPEHAPVPAAETKTAPDAKATPAPEPKAASTRP
jgi:F-type H+-transporting ATPase subunit b